MEWTKESIQRIGFASEAVQPSDALMLSAVIEWMQQNTDYPLSEDVQEDEIAKLPSGAKLFMLRMLQTIQHAQHTGVVISESIGGMSKSYASGTERAASLHRQAMQLLGKHYLGGRIGCIPDVSRWF